MKSNLFKPIYHYSKLHQIQSNSVKNTEHIFVSQTETGYG